MPANNLRTPTSQSKNQSSNLFNWFQKPVWPEWWTGFPLLFNSRRRQWQTTLTALVHKLNLKLKPRYWLSTMLLIFYMFLGGVLFMNAERDATRLAEQKSVKMFNTTMERTTLFLLRRGKEMAQYSDVKKHAQIRKALVWFTGQINRGHYLPGSDKTEQWNYWDSVAFAGSTLTATGIPLFFLAVWHSSGLLELILTGFQQRLNDAINEAVDALQRRRNQKNENQSNRISNNNHRNIVCVLQRKLENTGFHRLRIPVVLLVFLLYICIASAILYDVGATSSYWSAIFHMLSGLFSIGFSLASDTAAQWPWQECIKLLLCFIGYCTIACGFRAIKRRSLDSFRNILNSIDLEYKSVLEQGTKRANNGRKQTSNQIQNRQNTAVCSKKTVINNCVAGRPIKRAWFLRLFSRKSTEYVAVQMEPLSPTVRLFPQDSQVPSTSGSRPRAKMDNSSIPSRARKIDQSNPATRGRRMAAADLYYVTSNSTIAPYDSFESFLANHNRADKLWLWCLEPRLAEILRERFEQRCMRTQNTGTQASITPSHKSIGIQCSVEEDLKRQERMLMTLTSAEDWKLNRMYIYNITD